MQLGWRHGSFGVGSRASAHQLLDLAIERLDFLSDLLRVFGFQQLRAPGECHRALRQASAAGCDVRVWPTQPQARGTDLELLLLLLQLVDLLLHLLLVRLQLLVVGVAVRRGGWDPLLLVTQQLSSVRGVWIGLGLEWGGGSTHGAPVVAIAHGAKALNSAPSWGAPPPRHTMALPAAVRAARAAHCMPPEQPSTPKCAQRRIFL